MSGKKADKQRFWIAYLLKDPPEGTNFKPDALHLTIIPWFVTEKDEAEVIRTFRRQFTGHKTFTVGVGDVIEFKSRRKIPVNLVSPTNNLISMHEQALHLFSVLEGRWAVKSPYVDKDYIPHVRRRAGHNLSEGDRIVIGSLSLVRAHRRGDELRIVTAKVDFSG